MALLRDIVQVLPAAQKAAIRNLLSQRKKLGDIRTARQEVEEANKLFKEISSRIGGKVFVPIFAVQGSRISSDDHNLNMEGVYVDLSSLYTQIDVISSSSSTKSAALQSDYLKSKVAVERLINDARTFAIQKRYKEFNEVHIIDFNSARNVTTAFPSAIIDPNTRLLELRPIGSTRAHVENRLDRVTRVYTKTIGPGIRGDLSTTFTPESMIDQKPETFWGTLVMTDVPTNQPYKLSNSSEIVVNGPVVEVYLRFSHIELLNVIRVLPFGEFPLQLLDIAYRPNNTSQVFYPIRDFESEATLDWVEINFPKIYASELRLSILQENPKQSIYHLPKSLVVNTDLFLHLIRARAEQIVGSSFFDSDLSRSLQRSTSQYEDALDDLSKLILTDSDLQKTSIDEIDLQSQLLSALGIVLEQVDSQQGKEFIDSVLVDSSSADEVVEVRKYEYLIGVREIEASYELYAPTCHFESDLYLPQATLSNIQLEVDEQRIASVNSWGPFFESSTEWSVDVGEGRILPIHPINFSGEYLVPTALDERLEFDRGTAVAFTRLGSATNDVLTIRRNGSILPKSGYVSDRQTGVTPVVKLTLQESFWDEDSIYTVDYEISPDSYSLDLLTLLDPRPLGQPEVHSEMGPDNDVILSKYPYVLYEIINQTGVFTKTDEEAVWTYTPPIANVYTGQLRIIPTVTDSIGQVLVTGNITGQFITGFWGGQSGLGPFNTSGMNSAYFNNPEGFAYYTQVQGVRKNFHVSDKIDPTGLLFDNPPEFTLAQLQEMPDTATVTYDLDAYTGFLRTEYVLGVGLDINSQIFAFDNVTYTPIEVSIGGQPARNISDYQTLQHPAFSIANITDREYEFIHAGRRLYFNQPVNGIEVRVNYLWLTEHIKVLSTLRCNKAINPDVTPKVDEIRLLMNTSIL